MKKLNLITSEAYGIFDKYVVSQEEAKKVLSYALSMQSMKMFFKASSDVSTKKSNVLLMGNTGVGKTLLANCIDKLGFKVFKMSARDITDEGIKGLSIRDYLNNFAKECFDADGKFNKSKLEGSVIFIDEFDKICSPYPLSGGGDHNLAIQENLLKFIEGQDYHTKHGIINTTDIMFVLCGNFASVRKLRRKEKKQSIGFVDTTEFKAEPLHKELQKTGMIAELAGRIALVAELKDLNREDLLSILTTAENNILEQYQMLFTFFEDDLPISDEDLDGIVDSCIKNETGARGLQTELDKLLMERCLDAVFNKDRNNSID